MAFNDIVNSYVVDKLWTWQNASQSLHLILFIGLHMVETRSTLGRFDEKTSKGANTWV